jgi:hypothetical protein
MLSSTRFGGSRFDNVCFLALRILTAKQLSGQFLPVHIQVACNIFQDRLQGSYAQRIMTGNRDVMLALQGRCEAYVTSRLPGAFVPEAS